VRWILLLTLCRVRDIQWGFGHDASDILMMPVDHISCSYDLVICWCSLRVLSEEVKDNQSRAKIMDPWCVLPPYFDQLVPNRACIAACCTIIGDVRSLRAPHLYVNSIRPCVVLLSPFIVALAASAVAVTLTGRLCLLLLGIYLGFLYCLLPGRGRSNPTGSPSIYTNRWREKGQ
jgi:hypothetical protein